MFSLKALLNEYPRIRVPDFQRPYSWDQDQIVQLWDDIYSALSNGSEYWLLGNVILSGADDGGPDLVIDGQQRLSSLTILAAAIRDVAIRQNQEEDLGAYRDLVDLATKVHGNFIAIEIDEYGTEFEPRLTTGEENDWLRSHIQQIPDKPYEPDTWEGQYEPPIPDRKKGRRGIPNKIPDERRRYWAAYHQYFDKVSSYLLGLQNLEEKVAALRRLAAYLGNNVQLVVTKVPSEEVAYVLFEAINDRGLDLSVSDLVKNMLFQSASKKRLLQVAKDSWSNIVDALDYPQITSFIRYKRMMDTGSVIRKDGLYSNLRDHVSKMKGPDFRQYLRKLRSSSEQYAEITLAPDGANGPTSMDDRLRREVFIFNRFGYTTSHPFLLAGWSVSSSTEWRIQLLNLVESFMVKYSTLGGQTTNRLESDFPELAQKLLSGGEEALQECEDALTRILADESVDPWSKWHTARPKINIARGMLMRIEQEVAGDEKLIGPTTKVHVEHIFPQSPDEDWLRAMGIEPDKPESETEAQLLAGRIGNLCLLGAEYNNKASNNPFPDKVATSYSETSFEIAKRLNGMKAWNAKQLQKNSEYYLGIAKRVWSRCPT